MTKANLINAVYEQTGLPKDEASNMVELVLNIMKTTLVEGKTLKRKSSELLKEISSNSALYQDIVDTF